jgi:hypothetical protein
MVVSLEDSHHLDKVNFSSPWQTNSTRVQVGCAHQPQESSIQHGIQSRLGNHGWKATYILKSTCNQEIFHIARTIANSKVQCLVIQFEGRKCERKVAQGSSCTQALVFYGWFKPIGNKYVKYKTMWFCPNDMSCCVLGDVRDFVKGKPQVLEVWLVFTGTKLTQMEVAFLEEASFHLPKHALVEDGGKDPNANDIPIPKCRAPKFLVDPLEGPSMRQCGRSWNLGHDPDFQH